MSQSGLPRVDRLAPAAAMPGGQVELLGTLLGPAGGRVPTADLGGVPAAVLLSQSRRAIVRVPAAANSGPLRIGINGQRSNAVTVKVASQLAENLNPVTNPAIDARGTIFATFSGPRGQAVPVSVLRIDSKGDTRPFLSGLMNATGLAFDPAGYLYVSSRHEGIVYRVSPGGASAVYAEGMGVATGIAFDDLGNLYVGDRSGTIFKIAQDQQIFVFATLEPSVAAYHLAFGNNGVLYVSGPTISGHDTLYAIDRDGATTPFYRGLGRPMGVAVAENGDVYIAASLRGRRGVVRITPGRDASLAVAGSGIVGLALRREGGAVIATGDAVYDLALDVQGRLRF